MVKPVTNVKYLDEIITARGTNKRDLARTMGMSYDVLCRKMKGKARFTLQDSLNIAMALKLSPEDFADVFFGFHENEDVNSNMVLGWCRDCANCENWERGLSEKE